MQRKSKLPEGEFSIESCRLQQDQTRNEELFRVYTRHCCKSAGYRQRGPLVMFCLRLDSKFWFCLCETLWNLLLHGRCLQLQIIFEEDLIGKDDLFQNLNHMVSLWGSPHQAHIKTMCVRIYGHYSISQAPDDCFNRWIYFLTLATPSRSPHQSQACKTWMWLLNWDSSWKLRPALLCNKHGLRQEETDTVLSAKKSVTSLI